MDTYYGHVRTPADAIILFEACRLGLLPRVQRRLSEKERQSIKSGSVFVWDEREAGMRRWTDGKSWSASRVSGSFLTYREMEGKRGGNGFPSAAAAAAAAAAAPSTRAGKTPESTRGSDSEMEAAPTEDSPDGYRYKPDGLMKQSFSITTSTSNHLHLISYYSRTHPSAQSLPQPSIDPALRHIRPQKGMYPESTVQDQQSIPAVTRSPMVSGPLAQMPQMAGYARPSQSYQQGPPPSLPQATPPQATPPHTWPSPPPSQYAGSYSQYPASYGPPPHLFRHSTPPADTLPRPHPSVHHRSASSSSISYPQYLRAPSPLSNSTAPHSTHASPAPPSRHHSLSPTPPLAKIDPRLIDSSTTPVPFSFPPPINHASAPHTRSPSPALASITSVRSRGTTDTSAVSMPITVAPASTTAALKTIPGIGTLMQEHASREASGSPRQGDVAALLLAGASSGAGGNGSISGDGPRDIPSEKLGFGEDMRALRVLDRAFKT